MDSRQHTRNQERVETVFFPSELMSNTLKMPSEKSVLCDERSISQIGFSQKGRTVNGQYHVNLIGLIQDVCTC